MPVIGAERVRPSEEALEFAREHVEGLRRAVPAVRLRLEQQRAEQAERERQAAAAQVARAYKAANDSALALQKILGQADNAARSLVEARASVDVAVHDSAGAQTDDASLPLRRRSPDLLGWGTGRAPDGWVDEPNYLQGLEVLLWVLSEEHGPRRPLADAEAELPRRPSASGRTASFSPGSAGTRTAHPRRSRETTWSPALRAEVEEVLAAARSAASARNTDGEHEQPEREHEEAGSALRPQMRPPSAAPGASPATSWPSSTV